MHLGLQPLEGNVHCGQTRPHSIESVGIGVCDRFGIPTLEVCPKVITLVLDHEQKGSSQVVGLELRHGIEPLHETLEVAAVLLELPPAVHFYQR